MKTLYDINIGDKVLVHSQFYDKIRKVAAITKTQILLEDGQKFRKSNGFKVGCAEKFDINRIYVLTSEMEQQIFEQEERTALVSKIRTSDLGNLSMEQLRAILEIINK